ncbi:Pup--protein ligase [Rarobacter faecitabidus]|uniref:Pup--protein ligase n=1 Tax=Rarobacter faecitabidus TaxID=13243 RepID=A0A542ZVN7_RARFA|nr:Pup--protein ligase [Rarobacter faecitabidus]TQL64425.1 proteasome accessory factor A [Rarobacter faecitabidus]
MSKRIFGLETEFGITFAPQGERTYTPDELARMLFRKVVAWGRSSNVFLGNGSRLYLDVGSHPEYATAECDGVEQLIAHDRAGERVLESLVADAQEQIAAAGVLGRVHVLKNNTDSAGNSYGCHENYLLRRQGDFTRVSEILVPHLITRQILIGAGKIVVTPRGAASYAFSQRADHIWETVSSSTTRSRPIINTRDEPHADAERYRRLHVIVGDSSMAEPTTLLKVGAADLVLRMIEAGVPMRDYALANPMRAIREISHDISGKAPIELSSGRTMTAIDLQREYLGRAKAFIELNEKQPHDDATIELWERGLDALETGDLSRVESELDWAIKLSVIRRYQERTGADLADPRIARLDLAYHDIDSERGLYSKLVKSGLVRTMVSPEEITAAIDTPPQTTRARLRGDFVAAASRARRDYTVDWMHLKINDLSQRTVRCSDPFKSVDERVDKLMEQL